jgi:hypothetical protein
MAYVCKFPSCLARGTGIKCDKQCPALPVRKEKGSAGLPPRKTAIVRQTPKAKQRVSLKGLVFQNDAAFYMEIWLSRPHICFECGKPIMEHFSINLCHHVLSKKKGLHEYSDYSKYRHCRYNIVFCHFLGGCHTSADADNAPKVREYKERLIELHESGVLSKISPHQDYIP